MSLKLQAYTVFRKELNTFTASSRSKVKDKQKKATLSHGKEYNDGLLTSRNTSLLTSKSGKKHTFREKFYQSV